MVKVYDPLVIPWRGRQVRIRHDDPRIGPYTPTGASIRSAIELASDVDSLRLVLATAPATAAAPRSATTAASWGCGGGHEKRPARLMDEPHPLIIP